MHVLLILSYRPSMWTLINSMFGLLYFFCFSYIQTFFFLCSSFTFLLFASRNFTLHTQLNWMLKIHTRDESYWIWYQLRKKKIYPFLECHSGFVFVQYVTYRFAMMWLDFGSKFPFQRSNSNWKIRWRHSLRSNSMLKRIGEISNEWAANKKNEWRKIMCTIHFVRCKHILKTNCAIPLKLMSEMKRRKKQQIFWNWLTNIETQSCQKVHWTCSLNLQTRMAWISDQKKKKNNIILFYLIRIKHTL